MKANYEDKLKSSSTEVAFGNLYDLNKQLMAQEPPISTADLLLAMEHLGTWVTKHFKQKYLMLLCHELRDYTLFNLTKTTTWRDAPLHLSTTVVEDILECMTNRGTLLSIEDQTDGSWELWIRNEDGCFAYYLFPYGDAVLEY